MSTEMNTININIMGRDFRIKCPPQKVSELQEAAYLLDNKMREITNGGKFIGLDKLAVIAALNISHDLLSQKQKNNSYLSHLNAITSRLYNIQNKIKKVLVTAG